MTDQTNLLGVAFRLPQADQIPPHEFALKDKRHDPLVGAVLWTVRNFLDGVSPICDETSIISLTDRGCISHLNRVIDGVSNERPRQAFFTRASANMISTYASMALQNHGPCFSLSGGSNAVGLAIDLADQLMASEMCKQAILLSADYDETDFWTAAVLVNDDLVHQYSDWASGEEYEDQNPSQCLHRFLARPTS